MTGAIIAGIGCFLISYHCGVWAGLGACLLYYLGTQQNNKE